MNDDQATPIFDSRLWVDEKELVESRELRAAVTDISDRLKLLATENRLRLLLKRVDVRPDGDQYSIAATTLKLAGAPHPDCVFSWVVLSLDLSPTPGAIALGIEPTSVDAVKVNVSRSATPSIKASFSEASLEASLGGKKEVQYEFTRPQLIGVNFENRVMWTFAAPAEESDLLLDHDLTLRTRFPAAPLNLRALVTIKARVAFRGYKGWIPLIGRLTADEELIVSLDRMY